jgi:oligogalacturonide lyase
MLALLPAGLATAQIKKPAARAISGAIGGANSRARPLPSVGEFVRFPDPVTETPVVRLTNTRTSSVLPAATNRFVSVRERFLVFASDRGGKFAPFRVDLRTGVVRQIADTDGLQARSLCLDAKERSLYFIDDGTLKEVGLIKGRVETIAEGVTSFSASAADGGFFIVRNGKLEQRGGGNPVVLAEDVGSECWSRPGGAGCLFARESGGEREFWYVAGRAAAAVRLASGRISSPFWAPDGRSIVFLRDVSLPERVASEIHEAALGGGGERCVAPTSQFASFAPNGDGSVFVGASRSKAQPTIVLLLRSARREMTLCEHHASQAANVSPVFSPDSKRVYFQSDHQGKPAIYSVNVELLVEPLAG